MDHRDIAGRRWVDVVKRRLRELRLPVQRPAQRTGYRPGAGAGPFKEALVADGIPFTSFAVSDIGAEFARLRALGVRFTQEPVAMGPVTTAVFDDTCGNLIQIAQRQ